MMGSRLRCGGGAEEALQVEGAGEVVLSGKILIFRQASKWLPDRPATSAAAAELGEQGEQHGGRQDQQLW